MAAGRSAATLLAMLLAISCAGRAQAASMNFSQYPGFAEYFAAHPPTHALPSAEERTLLERHRPRFFLPEPHDGLIDFYADYVAQATLRDGRGRLVADRVTRAILNAHKDDPEAVLTHAPEPDKAPHPVVYGRADRVEMRRGSGGADRLTVLTYHAVFRRSGLPAGLLGWQALILGLVGDLDDWHQLDHYTAVSLMLDDAGHPVALMCQQHNYLRTHLLGETISLPPDGRPLVDVAIRSNELYPHREGRANRRAVDFLTPGNFRYLMGAGARPMLTADDVTDPAREADYRLEFLPPSDAFYTFQGFLGARRRLPGRDGPPGADYSTLPEMKPLDRQILAGYWREDHAGDAARLEASLRTPAWWLAFAETQREIFAANLDCFSGNRRQRSVIRTCPAR